MAKYLSNTQARALGLLAQAPLLKCAGIPRGLWTNDFSSSENFTTLTMEALQTRGLASICWGTDSRVNASTRQSQTCITEQGRTILASSSL